MPIPNGSKALYKISYQTFNFYKFQGEKKNCVGGISKDIVKQISKDGLLKWTSMYMLKIPRKFHNLTAQGLKKQLREFR